MAAMAIWLPDHTIVFSNDRQLAARKYPPLHEVQDAFRGNKVKTTLWDRRFLTETRDDTATGWVRTVYAPLFDQKTGKVIAVAEIADDASALRLQLDAIRRRTWLVVGLFTLLMLAILFVIVNMGSRTIDEQRRELEQRLKEEERLRRTTLQRR